MLWQLNSIRDVPLFSLSLATSELSWWLSSKESACQCRRHRFSPWVGKIPWSRKWQPTPILLPRKLHGQRSLAATVHWVSKCRTRLSIHTDTHTHTRTHTRTCTHKVESMSVGPYNLKRQDFGVMPCHWMENEMVKCK